MSINPLTDISRVYLEQVSESAVPGKPAEKLGAVTLIPKAEQEAARQRALAKAKAMREKNLTKEALDPVGQEDSDIDNDGDSDKSDKYLHKRRKAVGKAIATRKEALDPVGKEDDDIDNDGDIDKSDTYLRNRRKVRTKAITKEGFSSWRKELSEVMDDVEASKKIKEKKLNNKITINPKLSESVDNIAGGTLIEMVEIQNFDDIFDELSESEIFFLNDYLIEEVVEDVFLECLDGGYSANDVENVLLESLEISHSLLNEAKVTLGHDTKIKSDRLEKVKSAVKKVGKAVARGVGYAAGVAARGAKSAKREFGKGYERGRGGSSDSSSSAQSSSSQTGSSKSSLLSRIGSKLKSGLKRVIAKGARSVSRGARNVARKMEGGDKTPSAARTGTRKASTYRGAGVGTKEKVSSGSYKGPEKKKSEPVADPWKGSETAPPKAKAKAAPKVKAKPAAKPKATRAKKTSKLDDLLASVRSEEVQIDEKVLSAAETKKKEELVKSMKKSASDFETRYPGRGKEVMYATATKMAKKVAEQAIEMQPKTSEQPDQQKKKVQQQHDRMRQQEVQIMQKKLQALRSAPKGSDPSITAGYEPEGEMIDERSRYAKETGKKFTTGRASVEGGDPKVAERNKPPFKYGGSRQAPKERGKKPPVAGEPGSGRQDPAHMVKVRRGNIERAKQNKVGSRFD